MLEVQGIKVTLRKAESQAHVVINTAILNYLISKLLDHHGAKPEADQRFGHPVGRNHSLDCTVCAHVALHHL